MRGRADRRFNPRPPISQRATTCDGGAITEYPVSIHARQFHSGRRSGYMPCASGQRRFQSTPANFTAGDHPRVYLTDGQQPFQSTPANFTAGDACGQQHPGIEDVVSIHARQFHSGRLVDGLPAPAHRHVSIHARQFHSGRLQVIKYWEGEVAFQSTPANFTAGDPPTITGRRPVALFQSTPANFTAGDGTAKWSVCNGIGFNPRPPISQRAT